MKTLQWADWIRWGVGGLIAGLVAYGSIGSRLATVETHLIVSESRAIEDRAIFRETVNQLRLDVFQLQAQVTRMDARTQATADGNGR